MKTKIRTVVFTCLLGLSMDACSPAGQKHDYAQTLYFHDHSFDIFTVTYPKKKIRFFWKDDSGNKLRSIDNLKKLLGKRGEKLEFACNGGMYMEDNSPLGLYIENGKELARINLTLEGKGNFYLQPNGIFYLTDSTAKIISTEKYVPFKDKTIFATQSGPMLVNDGVINKSFSKGSSNTTIRNGVGIDENGQLIFVISNEPVNFYDFATLFRDELKCRNALFLDGSISRMYLPELGRNDLGGDFGVMIGVVN